MTSYLKRTASNNTASPCLTSGSDPAFAKSCPALFEFLTALEWESDVPRVAGTMLVFMDGSLWKACLTDKDQALYAFISADTFESLLKTVNASLISGKVDWRKQKVWEPDRKRKQ